MKKYYLIFLLLHSGFLYAQQGRIDSLLSVLKNHIKEDTVRINLLNEIAFSYYSIDPEKGVAMADKAILLSQKLKNTRKIAASYRMKGLSLSASGLDSLALIAYQKALALYKQTGDQMGMAKAYNNLGILYTGLSNYPAALNYHLQSLEILQKLKVKQLIANALNNTGAVYQYLANYQKALTYYLQALKIYEDSGDKDNIVITMNNIGVIYTHLSRYKKSMEYHQRALAIARQSENRIGEASSLDYIGTNYDYLNQPDKALVSYDKALSINKLIGNKRNIAANTLNIGIVYNNLRNYSKALGYLKTALADYSSLQDKNNQAMALAQMANIYAYAPKQILINQGIDPVQRYNKAIELQKQGLLLVTAIGATDQESEAWKNLGEIYEKQGKQQDALAAYKKHYTLKDSLSNSEVKEEIASKISQYEYDKKEAQLKAAQEKKQLIATAEINRQRLIKNISIGGACILILGASIIFSLYKRKRDAVEQQKEAEFKAEVSDTEMKALRLQMNPHFIFNSLNSISDYISKNNIQLADEYLVKFARVMRMILENSEHQEIPLSDDLKALELYMELESLRLNYKFTYEINIDEKIEPEQTLIPPLLLQPFIENSIWHGLSAKQGDGKIMISFKLEDETMICKIDDNGTGRKAANQTYTEKVEKKSLGMKITKSRIDILNKTKQATASVELTDLPEGTSVELRLPYQLAF